MSGGYIFHSDCNVCMTGDWVRRDSGVGAGIDSYYEYLLKAYVLLGDEGYLERFNKVSALLYVSNIMKYKKI